MLPRSQMGKRLHLGWNYVNWEVISPPNQHIVSLRMTMEFIVTEALSFGQDESLQAQGGECSLPTPAFSLKRLILSWFCRGKVPNSSSIHPLCLHVPLVLGKVHFWRISSFLNPRKVRYYRWFSITHGCNLCKSVMDAHCQRIFCKCVCVSYLFCSIHETWSSQEKTTPMLVF